MEIYNADCLELMNSFESNSIDFVFCDLPYGETTCSWDTEINLERFWKIINKITKKDAPIIFTASTKFGVKLINSNPKNFRYDLVWVKSAPCGFLNAKKMPMKKHEMIYVFYRKLPKIYGENIKLYHKHKFLKERDTSNYNKSPDGCYNIDKRPDGYRRNGESKYSPPLPTTIVKEGINVITREPSTSIYTTEKNKIKFSDENGKIIPDNQPRYDPPLPTSVVKNEEYENRVIKPRNTIKGEETYGKDYLKKKENFRAYNPKLGAKGEESNLYQPPLPTSVCNYDVNKNVYGGGKEGRIKISKDKQDHQQKYEPPLPTSVVKTNLYSTKNNEEPRELYRNPPNQYDPPLPNTILKESVFGKNYLENKIDFPERGSDSRYEPPLPHTILEVKSEKGKHPTQKPTDLIKWLLKYYTKEGDIVLDPTMGSGTTGVACIEMKRDFIGIEKDENIFKIAEERLERC